jgi:hypothetical protein
VLFSAGEQGAVFDTNLLTTLFQDTAGVTSVTAPGQTTALALNTIPGLVLGSEVVVNGDFATDTNWVKDTGWTIGGGVLSYDGTDAPNAVYQVSAILASGKSYRVSITVTMTQGALAVRPQFNSAAGAYQITSSGTYSILLSGLGGSLGLLAASFGSRFIGTVDNISVKELPGIHATQATAGARPTYRNPSGVPYLEDDGGDSMNWAAPAGTYTVARVNSAGTVTILTAQALSGATDMLLDAQTTAYVAVNRALTSSETEMLTTWLRSRAGL